MSGVRRRRFPAPRASALAVPLLLLVLPLLLTLATVHGYRRLTHEEPVAEIGFRQLAPRRFQARLQPARGQGRLLELYGDEWQLDARVLRWSGPAQLLGLDTRYRLERLSGRYRDPVLERSARRSVHDLRPGGPGRLFEPALRWLPWVDAVYGSAAYTPMTDGARYRVFMARSGLVVRAANAAARAALETW